MKKQAVNIQTEDQYNQVIEFLKANGCLPFQLGETFRKCFITIENRYMQLIYGSKILTDSGYEIVSFEEFAKENKLC